MKKLFEKIRALFIRIKPKFQNTIETAVIVTQRVKEVLSNPAVDALTALTPFQHDERILKALRSAIGYLSDVLSIANEFDSPSEQLKKIAEVLHQRHPQFRKLFYREMAAAVAHALSDGKLTAWELFTLTQTAYRAIKDNELDTSNIQNEDFENDIVEMQMTDSLKKMQEESPAVADALTDIQNAVQSFEMPAPKDLSDESKKNKL